MFPSLQHIYVAVKYISIHVKPAAQSENSINAEYLRLEASNTAWWKWHHLSVRKKRVSQKHNENNWRKKRAEKSVKNKKKCSRETNQF